MVQVVPLGIPKQVTKTDELLNNHQAKTLNLTRVPGLGEWIIWRNQNFKITRVSHISEGDVAARVEMLWYENC